jgi:hypothetical protein
MRGCALGSLSARSYAGLRLGSGSTRSFRHDFKGLACDSDALGSGKRLGIAREGAPV